ncbi:hypothetical protein F5Y19DRAFT_479315 [Xylariaceae sp. FL1651]|nr:hypothetical protein F5Y19DRAFT_479315 [Xylariaceae sp. FL1651]
MRTDSTSFDPNHAALFILCNAAIPLCIGGRLVERAIERNTYADIGVVLLCSRRRRKKGVARWVRNAFYSELNTP